MGLQEDGPGLGTGKGAEGGLVEAGQEGERVRSRKRGGSGEV